MARLTLALVALTLLAACGSDVADDRGDAGAADVRADAVTADVGPTDTGGGPADTGGGLDAAGPDVPAADVPRADVPVTDVPPADVPVTDVPVTDVPPADVAADVDVGPLPLPRALPFEFTRPADGEPIPAADVTAFTKQVTGLWKDIGWFRWLLRTSSGVDASTGTDDYLAWHNDVTAIKSGDLVTFQQRGLEHNMWIPGSKVLSEVVNGYLLTGDWELAKLAEQYCKGLTAVVKGFIWDENDPAPYLMARAVFPMDQEFTLDEETWHDDGRRKAVQFSTAYRVEDNWNAHSFAWPHNPTWGSIWVTNMRSKDDVCAIVRTTAFLPYVVEDAPDEWVREACAETLQAMRGFNKDIVDYGYYIRTKDADGTARLVTEEDLGSYVEYTALSELNECTARLASDLIAYGERRTNDCGTGFPTMYDLVAGVTHYYNYPILWNYHMAALGNALVANRPEMAAALLEGLTTRIDRYRDPESDEAGQSHHEWNRDMAVLLVQAASFGFPLTATEARHVQAHWTQAIADFRDWPYWDLWSPDVPDGEYGLRPGDTDGGVPVEALTLFLEYCNSPFQNPSGAVFVDCDVVRDVTQWGVD